MIKTLDPWYVVPSHKYFNETEIPKLYGQLWEKVEKYLRELKYSTTTNDLWSSRTKEPYLNLTIHFTSDEWELANCCLLMQLLLTTFSLFWIIERSPLVLFFIFQVSAMILAMTSGSEKGKKSAGINPLWTWLETLTYSHETENCGQRKKTKPLGQYYH